MIKENEALYSEEHEGVLVKIKSPKYDWDNYPRPVVIFSDIDNDRFRFSIELPAEVINLIVANDLNYALQGEDADDSVRIAALKHVRDEYVEAVEKYRASGAIL